MKLTPRESVKAYCIQCLGLIQFNQKAIEDCQGDRAANGACPLYPYRLGKRPSVKVFRQYCLYCQGGSKEAVADCIVKDCPCYPYRYGKNPALIGKRKAPQKGMEALKKYRETHHDDLKKSQGCIFSYRDEATIIHH